MVSDIGKIDRILKPEPLKTHDRGGNSRNTGEHAPAGEDKEDAKEDERGEAPPEHLLDVRI